MNNELDVGEASMTEARTKIIRLFEKHRATPGAPYDEDHFLDFLLADPKRKGALYDSFRGLRRFRAFLDDVQYELEVCFSIEDREANYPLNKFIARAMELQQSRRGSLRSLQRQINAGPGWGVLIVADVLLLTIGSFLSGSLWALTTVVTLAVAVNISFALFAWKARSYLLKLRARIKGN
ncbi:hypothetical protein CO671_15750 [Rhizobium sp. M10]|nr:hypothetical protein CO671_15750 [Rhizobium sp. M10]